MVIYSVTVTVNKEIELEWLEWMREVHIPEVMATGCFLSSRLSRLIDPILEPGTATFNVQYLVENLGIYKRYLNDHAPDLQKAHSDRYEGKFVAFRTLLRQEAQFEEISAIPSTGN